MEKSKWLIEHVDKDIKVNAAQLHSLKLAARRPGFLHFEEQGLGKTAMVLAEFVDLVEVGRADNLIVVCPNTLKKTWMLEADDWKVPYNQYIWPDDMGKKLDIVPKPPYIATFNYEAVGVGKGFEFIKKKMMNEGTMMAIDESICMKNPRSKRTDSILDMTKKVPFKRPMSGAPMSQGAHDLWAQFRAAGLIEGTLFNQFKYRYCEMGGFQGKKIIGVRESLIGELYDIIDQNGFRGTLEEWTDIPKTINAPTRMIKMTKIQRDLYLEMLNDFITEFKPGEFVEVDMVITQLLKLHQISSGILIDEDSVGHELIPPGQNPKLIEMGKALDEIVGKVLIFTKFKLSTDIVFKWCDDKGLHPVLLKGGMKPHEVETEKSKFNKDPKYRICVVQSDSHMYGHTLLGGKGKDRCHNTFYYEVDYNLNTRVQTQSRNVRHGQDQSVVYSDFTVSPVEFEAINALRKKRDVSTAVLDLIRGHVPSWMDVPAF